MWETRGLEQSAVRSPESKTSLVLCVRLKTLSEQAAAEDGLLPHHGDPGGTLDFGWPYRYLLFALRILHLAKSGFISGEISSGLRGIRLEKVFTDHFHCP